MPTNELRDAVYAELLSRLPGEGASDISFGQWQKKTDIWPTDLFVAINSAKSWQGETIDQVASAMLDDLCASQITPAVKAAIIKDHLASMSRNGGLAKSGAKTCAVRENGKKGGWPKGRPRKVPPVYAVASDKGI